MDHTFHNRLISEHEVFFHDRNQIENGLKITKERIPLMIKTQHSLKENIASPEFNLFHMASPDLERLIIGQASTVGTTNGRETSTLNISDLNVLHLSSPDFEKAFSNFLANNDSNDLVRRENYEKERSVQSQHEIYAETFVDALRKAQNQDFRPEFREERRETERNNFAVKGYESDFEKEDRNGNKLGQNHGICGQKFVSEDKNMSRIEQYDFSVRRRHLDKLEFNHSEDRNRNTIRASHVSHEKLKDKNSSALNIRSHPELFKLHAHVELSENLQEHLAPMRELIKEDIAGIPNPQMLPLPPIDLQVQEIVKRERKKQKNRVAASKCRKKKLEREAQLEVRVQQLRERHIELNALANALRGQVTDLKQRVMEHIACGCHLTTVTH